MDTVGSVNLNPLLYSQPACVEKIKNQQKNGSNDDASLKKVSQDFESVLVNFAIKEMWKTIPKSELFAEEGSGLETYTEIMNNALAEDISAKGGIGIAPVIYRQLVQNKGLPYGDKNLALPEKKKEIKDVKNDGGEECSPLNVQY